MHNRYLKVPCSSPARSVARPWLAPTVFAAVAVLSIVGYLVQVSSTSAKSSEIRQLQKEVAQLKDQSERAELRLAQGSSVAAVEAKIQTLGLVPADRLEYVTPTSLALARK